MKQRHDSWGHGGRRSASVAVSGSKALLALLVVVVLSNWPLCMKAQPQEADTSRLIYLLHANKLSFDKQLDAERQVLTGDVRFRHDSAYLYCDMAYFYRSTNSMVAFSNVRMEQGDSLFLFCDTLAYDGNTSTAHCTDRVYMFHNSTVLCTDYLVYDRLHAEAHYPETGVIVDSASHLYSQLGWYYPQRRRALFRDDVQLRSYDYSDRPVRAAVQDGGFYGTMLDSLIWTHRVEHYGYRRGERLPNDRLVKPDIILYSDTLTYDVDEGRARIDGPSRIVNDSATVYTTLGDFLTGSGVATLYNRSSVVANGRFATGDRMTYDTRMGIGEGWGSVVMHDTLQHMRLEGDYVHFVREPRRATVTGRALAMEFGSKDTLYLHADTLRAYTVLRDTVRSVVRDSLMTVTRDSTVSVMRDTLMQLDVSDSVRIDTLMRIRVDSLISLPSYDTLMQVQVDSAVVDTMNYMTAHFNVRYYRTDLQGICDSLNYNAHDSLATFVGNPVMWNGMYQITGDTIFAIVAQDGIHQAMIHDNAFLVQQKDSIHYDQIAGKELVCFFDSSRVERMEMSGNVQTIFYPEESDKTLIGLNQVVGNYLSIWFKNNKMDHLTIWPQPIGSLTPIPLIQDEQLYLEKFRWMDYLRPTDPQDVFRDIRMKEEDKQESERLFDDNELNGY